MTSTNW